MSKKEPIAIDRIRTDGGTQMRAELTTEVYMDYRDKWLAGVEFDPVDVFHDGSTYWLADGFHRFYGAREAKRGSIPCRVHQGTQRDAILFACGANDKHGLRRTNLDKRQAVLALLNDDEWCTWSDNKIAESAAVSVQTVSNVRAELSKIDSSPVAKSKDKPRTGRDGKQRRPRSSPPSRASGSPPPPPSLPSEGTANQTEAGSQRSGASGGVKHKEPKQGVFVDLRNVFDAMTKAERAQAAMMWESWLDEQ